MDWQDRVLMTLFITAGLIMMIGMVNGFIWVLEFLI